VLQCDRPLVEHAVAQLCRRLAIENDSNVASVRRDFAFRLSRVVYARGLNNMFGENRPRRFNAGIRVDDGSAGLNGLPCFVECSDKNANLIRIKGPCVFLEVSNARETSLDCRGVRVANTARLDANAHLVVAGILKRAASLQRTLLVSVPQWLCRSHSFS